MRVSAQSDSVIAVHAAREARFDTTVLAPPPRLMPAGSVCPARLGGFVFERAGGIPGKGPGSERT